MGPELDCILARTAGRQVARTDKQIFNINDVLAVIQVKRTLYKSQIDEGFANLASVLTPNISASTTRDAVRRVFQQITGRPAPENPESLPPTENAIWHTIVIELNSPTRILLGFDGYANESTFRKGLVDHLTEKQGQFGSGPLALPSLIIGGNASAIKGVGLPWSSAVINGWWQFLGTTSTIKPAHLFLESIWTRLVIAGYADDRLFGEDLDDEVFNAFIDARIREDGKGWELRYDDTKVKPEDEPIAFQPWTPHFVSHEAFVVPVHSAVCGVSDAVAIPCRDCCDGTDLVCGGVESASTVRRLSSARAAAALPVGHDGSSAGDSTRGCHGDSLSRRRKDAARIGLSCADRGFGTAVSIRSGELRHGGLPDRIRSSLCQRFGNRVAARKAIAGAPDQLARSGHLFTELADDRLRSIHGVKAITEGRPHQFDTSQRQPQRVTAS